MGKFSYVLAGCWLVVSFGEMVKNDGLVQVGLV